MRDFPPLPGLAGLGLILALLIAITFIIFLAVAAVRHRANWVRVSQRFDEERQHCHKLQKQLVETTERLVELRTVHSAAEKKYAESAHNIDRLAAVNTALTAQLTQHVNASLRQGTVLAAIKKALEQLDICDVDAAGAQKEDA
jgi:septal ring factor EnvC (AmiA/AmiB activator)